LRRRATLPVFLVGFASLSAVAATIPRYGAAPMGKAKRQLAAWMADNTTENDLLLNYSRLDARTVLHRSEFFRDKTIPLYEDAQRDWYRRYLIYHDVPPRIRPVEYLRARDHARGAKPVRVSRVLRRAGGEVTHLLVPRHGRFNQRRLLGLKKKRMVFSNGQYRVYRVVRRTAPVKGEGASAEPRSSHTGRRTSRLYPATGNR
jgi:hypothetical protein